MQAGRQASGQTQYHTHRTVLEFKRVSRYPNGDGAVQIMMLLTKQHKTMNMSTILVTMNMK